MNKANAPLAEMDVEAFMNMRDWLDAALTAAGAEITDGGIGAGRADTGFILEGMPFSVSLKPRPSTYPAKAQ